MVSLARLEILDVEKDGDNALTLDVNLFVLGKKFQLKYILRREPTGWFIKRIIGQDNITAGVGREVNQPVRDAVSISSICKKYKEKYGVELKWNTRN